MKLKFCGLKTRADAVLVNEFRPEYAGLVFAKSKRRVSRETAADIRKTLDKSIQAVGVFVNESVEIIAGLCADGIIDVVQLHGDEDKRYINALKQRVPNEMIKAIRVKDQSDIEKAAAFSCDYLLFDAYAGSAKGGTGQRFDWKILDHCAVKKPFFLAGGLTAENIADAAKLSPAPYCLDISSGIERGGVKNRALMQHIIHKIND
ncbi:MAG: phosphoribosylanthranilate isomerase [Clostridiales bacterium]|jgi:phosphoribosylanthranilate isomerase|nr:phosphoribosylanthranilate isomerase [Clostridiales bacterium]